MKPDHTRQDQTRPNWVQIAPNSSEWVKMVPYSGKNWSKWRSAEVTLVLLLLYSDWNNQTKSQQYKLFFYLKKTSKMWWLLLKAKTPCHRGNFNLNGGPYKMFQMIFLFVTKIFQNMLVFKILNEGVMVNQHSKRVTKP